MRNKPKRTPPLPEYFDALDDGSEWGLRCKTCGKAWSLVKDSDNPGNVLHLLNHALGHKEKNNED